jgi:hypothetical protein
MDIIFSRQVAEELAEKYVVLELEPNIVEDKILETFCVVPTEKISLIEITMLDHWKKLHNSFVQANKEKNAKLCHDLRPYLKGKWGGELDEFYDIVCGRFDYQEEPSS